MPTFECVVREQHREYRHPPVPASSLPEAIDSFRKRGLEVVRVVESTAPRVGSRLEVFTRAGEREVTLLFRNLAETLKSSLPLAEAIQLIGQKSRHPVIQNACREMLKELRNGSALSEAAARQGHVFSETHVRLLEAGERSGRLAEAAAEMADYREEISRIGWQVFSYFLYPLLIIWVGVNILFFLVTFIVPKFMQIFRDFKVEMPALTQLIMDLSNVALTVLPLAFVLTLAAAVVVFITRAALWTRPTRLLVDRWVLNMPLLGKAFYAAGLARVLGIMAMLARSRMPLPTMLETAGRAAGNSAIETQLLIAAERARTGSTLSDALTDTNVFPTVVTWRLAVAERTGNIAEALQSLAATYRADMQQMTMRRMRILEPILVLLLGVFVFAVVLSMFLPLLQIITNLTNE